MAEALFLGAWHEVATPLEIHCVTRNGWLYWNSSNQLERAVSKVHLTYRINVAATGAAYCGNNSRGYKYGLKAVMPKEFRTFPAEERCQHCERIYLEERNKIRRKKGLEGLQ